MTKGGQLQLTSWLDRPSPNAAIIQEFLWVVQLRQSGLPPPPPPPPPGITGRYVYIYLPTSEWMMNFCEVEEVFGVAYASEDRKISNERRTKSPNLNASRLGLQLSLRNIWKPGVKLRPKM